MKYFKLPDLGEGLPEAEIVEWFIKVGDTVEVDQVIVAVETAKAIVDVPSPQAGTIAALFGEEGDIIHTGEPLVEYAGENNSDTGTVVGDIKQASTETVEDHFIIGSANQAQRHIKATPSVRALARRLKIDLNTVKGTGRDGLITAEDIEQASRLSADKGDAKPLRGVRRTMAKNMALARDQVVQVSLHDDADIHCWPAGTDVTMRLVHAIRVACLAEPVLNAWYDGETMTLRIAEKIDLGIAVDTTNGLFVPVLRDISNRPMKDLRSGLNQLRADVKARTIPPKELVGSTITLSNFGTIAGRYASPIVVPPSVCIIGAGVRRDEVVAVDGTPQVHTILPISLSFDHRVATGGEAARFLGALLQDLQQATID